MKTEDELKLSFYKQIAVIDEDHGVTVVQDQDSGKIFVRKIMHQYDRSVCDYIKDNRFRGIPAIFEIVEDEGELTVIEDYISGKRLDEMMESASLAYDEAVRIIADLCDILEPLHAHVPPIIHRDIKPSNIIVNNAGEVFLLDFNASRVVTEGKFRDTELLGTAEYAAPEQYGFRQSDQRTDIYALGVLLHKLMTGGSFSDGSNAGIMDDVIKKATAMDPDSRYENVGQLKQAIIEADEKSRQEVEVDYYVAPQDGGNAERKRTDSLLELADHYIGGLPGLKSVSIATRILAACWYVLLFAFGFFGISKTEGWSDQKNKMMDIFTFSVLFSYTLYLGNYLGIRDRLPWQSSRNAYKDMLRIAAGCGILAGVLLLTGVIVMMVLHIE